LKQQGLPYKWQFFVFPAIAHLKNSCNLKINIAIFNEFGIIEDGRI
jgi:hypothetical protein